VISSPLEVPAIRAAVTRPDFIVVTPGIRPVGSANNDQKRVATPAAAIAGGADYLIVDRPTQARDGDHRPDDESQGHGMRRAQHRGEQRPEIRAQEHPRPQRRKDASA
jgi:orotidine-5'-phosphate decarboxylase